MILIQIFMTKNVIIIDYNKNDWMPNYLLFSQLYKKIVNVVFYSYRTVLYWLLVIFIYR